MNSVLLFGLITLSSTISIVFVAINKSIIDDIYLKFYKKPTNMNFSRVPFRILRLLIKFGLLTTAEKNVIIISFVSILVFYSSFILWGIYAFLY
jgi:hypothetical protein